MRIGCMPAGIIDPLRTGQGVRDIANAGFDAAAADASIFAKELRMETSVEEKWVMLSKEPQRTAEVLGPLLEQCERAKLPVCVIKTPTLRKDCRLPERNILMRQLAEECVRIAVAKDIPYVIVQPLFSGLGREDKWEANSDMYLSLAKLCKGTSTQILLENIALSFGGHLVRGICSDAGEAAEWVDALNHKAGEERFGFCFNVATSALCGQNPYEVIRPLQKRIKAVIVSDNDGIHDRTFLPFSTHCQGSQTDWLGVVRGLREIAFDGELLFAFEESAEGVSPMLRPKLMAFAKETADFIRWQLEIEKDIKKYPKRVLFGAGNMCINYMKNYGKAYPPLFTCDNNSARWGEEFAGLTIHSPQDLTGLSPDVAIFICNVYYREIEDQLRDMGLRNPICYFNDEYLPVLNMDRIDRIQEGVRHA